MIDRSNGRISFEDPACHISADFTPMRFLASPLAKLSGSLPSAAFTFQPVRWCGETLAGSLRFLGGILHCVQLQVIRPEFGTSWSDASEEKELARKLLHEMLATRALGEPLQVLVAHPGDPRRSMLGRNEAWGAVRSFYDAKAGFSALEVQYLVESVGVGAHPEV